METIYVIIAIFVIVLVFVGKSLHIIQQSETMIIERLGKYHSTLGSGINIIIPFVDKARPMIWRYSQPGPKGALLCASPPYLELIYEKRYTTLLGKASSHATTWLPKSMLCSIFKL